MSLQTYADLVSAVGSWLNRTDLATTIPDLIGLAEARIRRNNQWFRKIYSQTNSGNPLAITARPMILPTEVRELGAIWAASDPWQYTLEVISPMAWRDLAQVNDDVQGNPRKAILIPQMDTFLQSTGPQLYLWPTPVLDGSFKVDFTYIADPQPLSTAVNALFLRHPDLYLYGALAESAPFLQHDERIPTWETRYAQIVTEITRERDRAEYGPTPVPRLAVSF